MSRGRGAGAATTVNARAESFTDDATVAAQSVENVAKAVDRLGRPRTKR